MDLLASLNIEDLPEQETRMMRVMEEYPDFQMRLGFDACCTCGSASENPIECESCKRVSYCSDSCRQQDARAFSGVEGGDEEHDTSMGHSSIICALLKCCQDDEDVENSCADSMPENRRVAAEDRIRSELESYPATLSNVIMEGPCFQGVLKAKASSTRILTLHLIGASEDAELWDASNSTAYDKVLVSYADALSELAFSFGLRAIELFFIGPECPSTDHTEVKTLQSLDHTSVGELRVHTVKGSYTSDLLKNAGSRPDIVVFFNPGFTVPEYSWNETLALVPSGTPFLSTTNTELEGIADCQYLLEQDKIESLPVGLADIFGLHSEHEGDGDCSASGGTSFFNVNPFAGNRVRQSGTMANDLFVKNRWMIGGTIGSFDQSKTNHVASNKRLRTAECASNEKTSNPALI